MDKLKVGVIGGTGMVGQRFVTLIANHPWFELKVIAASSRSAGKTYEEAADVYKRQTPSHSPFSYSSLASSKYGSRK